MEFFSSLVSSGRIKGALGDICPPIRGSAPHLPPLEEQMAKISHFR